jgi:outer membrane protein assembly factor BamD
MSRRTLLIASTGLLLALTTACTNRKSVNPLSKIDSKQPDKVLFDKSMEAMRRNRFDVARMTLQTLINTYPDSEYIARAKLAVGDSWYAEGGTASLAQAEQEYRDFQTFFPNMPEAAEAQLKIANIQYQQMEKPDRDYTHAKRAEEEYRNLILQYPENTKLVAQGKQRLLEVQEVLADREFQIGRFYYLRQSYGASIARLETLVDRYPLYSHADEALYLLGENREGEIARIRLTPSCTTPGRPPGCAGEVAKSRLIEDLTKQAATAYDKILTRYPLMDRSDDAKKRLALLHQPIPRPTKAAVAENRKELESREEATSTAKMLQLLRKGPDTSQAARVGEPTLVETTPVSGTDVSNELFHSITGAGNAKTLGAEVIKADAPPPPNDAAPRSDAPPPAAGGSPFAPQPIAPVDPNELKPNATTEANEIKPAASAPDPNELKPTSDSQSDTDQTLPPPPQVNEIHNGQPVATASADASSSAPATDEEISSSKKKKKKGLKKLVPF